MNKIRSSVNIFPFFPLPCLKKLREEKTKYFAAGEKNESCAEYRYTPGLLLTSNLILRRMDEE